MASVAVVIPTLDVNAGWTCYRRMLEGQHKGQLASAHIAWDEYGRGFTRTVNEALRSIMVELFGYVLIMSDDCEPRTDGWLDSLVETMGADDELGFVSPLVPCRTEGMIGQQPTEEPGIHEIFAVPYGCCLIRREVFTDVGLLDPTFQHYASDTDHQLRANAFGWKSAWCSHVYVHREQHPPREPWWSRDRALFARRWGR